MSAILHGAPTAGSLFVDRYGDGRYGLSARPDAGMGTGEGAGFGGGGYGDAMVGRSSGFGSNGWAYGEEPGDGRGYGGPLNVRSS